MCCENASESFRSHCMGRGHHGHASQATIKKIAGTKVGQPICEMGSGEENPQLDMNNVKTNNEAESVAIVPSGLTNRNKASAEMLLNAARATVVKKGLGCRGIKQINAVIAIRLAVRNELRELIATCICRSRGRTTFELRSLANRIEGRIRFTDH